MVRWCSGLFEWITLNPFCLFVFLLCGYSSGLFTEMFTVPHADLSLLLFMFLLHLFQCALVCFVLMCLSTSFFFVTLFQDVSLSFSSLLILFLISLLELSMVSKKVLVFSCPSGITNSFPFHAENWRHWNEYYNDLFTHKVITSLRFYVYLLRIFIPEKDWSVRYLI